MLTRKASMRALSLFVVITFMGTLGAPFVQANEAVAKAAASASNTAAKMTATSSKMLGNLWFFWGDHIKKLKVKPTSETAFTFFKSRGATEQQALALVGNAQSNGHLTSTIAKSANATKNVFKSWFDKFTGIFKGNKATAATKLVDAKATTRKSIFGTNHGVEATVKPNLADRVRQTFSNFFSRFKGGAASSAAAGSAAKATGGEAASGSAAASKGGPNIFQKAGTAIKGTADKALLGAKRGAVAAGGATKTGYLTLTDKLDFNRYYEIPVQGKTTIKVRGEFKGVTKFTDGGWVVEKYVGKSKTPGNLGEQLGKVEMIASKPAPTGFFGKLFAKFKGSVTSVKNKMTGKGWTTAETQTQINKLKIEGTLMEQARMLNEAQRAIKYRMDHLAGQATSLRKPVPQSQISALQKQYDAIEVTKKQLARKIDGVQQSPAKNVVMNAAKWAVFSIGITASVNLIKQAFSGEGFNIKEIFAFMGEPQFWGGTVGGFLGATLLNTIFAGMLGAASPFLAVLPGFLGATLGFEFGAGLFGGQMDLLGSIVQTLASAGGYAMAISMVGGTWIPILAAIAAGSLASFILNKIRGGFASEAAFPLPPGPIVPADQVDVGGTMASNTAPPAEPAIPSTTSMSMAQASAQVKEAYNRYINLMKQRKLADARLAREDYIQAKKVLEASKANEVGN